MEKLYERINFVNGTSPALNANNLNLISKAIDDIDNRLVSVANNIADLAGLNEFLATADYVEKSNIVLSTSGTTTVVFNSELINATSAVEVWTSEDDIIIEDVTATRGSCTVVFAQVSSATTLDTVRIYFK